MQHNEREINWFFSFRNIEGGGDGDDCVGFNKEIKKLTKKKILQTTKRTLWQIGFSKLYGCF